MSRRDEVPPESIPEVVEFIEAKDMLNQFRAQHPQIFQHYDDLVGHYNTKLDAADKAVRGRQVSCDDWDKYQVQEKTNPEVVYEWGGREEFIRVGGKITKKTVLELDKARFKAAVAGGSVPVEVAEQAIVQSPRYKAPKPKS